MSATVIVLGIAAVVLFVAAIIAVNRIAVGPSQLDRSVAADLLIAVVVAAIGIWTVWTDRATELPILVLLSLLGFTSAVGIARLAREPAGSKRRYFTQAEEDESSNRETAS